MNRPLRIIAIFILITFAPEGKGQVSCTIPDAPVLQKVTINPENGNVTLNWKKSQSAGIAAYIIYKYNNKEGIPVDTIWNPDATSYIHINAGTGYFSVSYVVAAHRMPNCTSPLSNHLNTIFADAVTDTCRNKISIKWNSYESFPLAVKSYIILASRNGGQASKIAEVPQSQLNYDFTGFQTDAFYSFIIQATLENGDSSLSNKVSLTTSMLKPPDWINADYATVTDNKVKLSFTADPSSELSSYLLERKTGTSGLFAEIARIKSTNGVILYTDQNADPENINYYRLSAVNSCNIAVTISNTASNMVLKAEKVNTGIVLKWNRYESWNGQVSSYKILINTGNGFIELAETSAADSMYVVDYKNIMYSVTAGELCFEILTEEVFNPYGINGSSKSRVVCNETEEIITVPDVFTPNNDLINDLFRPVLSFTPAEYSLVISNRSGKTVFETRDHTMSWDGTDNGRKAMQDVYLWYMKLKTPSGKVISKTGTVTVYFNQ